MGSSMQRDTKNGATHVGGFIMLSKGTVQCGKSNMSYQAKRSLGVYLGGDRKGQMKCERRGCKSYMP